MVCATMPLPGRRRRIDQDIAFRRAWLPGRSQAQQSAELGVGTHCDQIAARIDPAGEHGDLAGRQGYFREDHQVVGSECRRSNRIDGGHREGIEALGPQDLRIVFAEQREEAESMTRIGPPGP